jgi:hypothetical protein
VIRGLPAISPHTRDRHAHAQRRLGRELDQPQHRRMQRIVHLRHVAFAAIHRQRVAVRSLVPMAKKSASSASASADKRGTRRLDHDAERRQLLRQRSPRRRSRRATRS